MEPSVVTMNRLAIPFALLLLLAAPMAQAVPTLPPAYLESAVDDDGVLMLMWEIDGLAEHVFVEFVDLNGTPQAIKLDGKERSIEAPKAISVWVTYSFDGETSLPSNPVSAWPDCAALIYVGIGIPPVQVAKCSCPWPALGHYPCGLLPEIFR